jgi:hypothetical protein
MAIVMEKNKYWPETRTGLLSLLFSTVKLFLSHRSYYNTKPKQKGDSSNSRRLGNKQERNHKDSKTLPAGTIHFPV